MLSECKTALRRGSSLWIRCCTCDHMRYDHMRSHEWIRSWNVLDLHRECCPNKRDCRSPLATSAQEILSKYWCVVASRGLSVDSERGVEGSSKRTASPPLCLFIKRVWGHFLGLCGVRRYSPKRIHKWMVGSTPTHDSWLVAASDRDKHGREYIYRETFKRSFTNTFTHAVLRTHQDENTYPERSSDSGAAEEEVCGASALQAHLLRVCAGLEGCCGERALRTQARLHPWTHQLAAVRKPHRAAPERRS